MVTSWKDGKEALNPKAGNHGKREDHEIEVEILWSGIEAKHIPHKGNTMNRVRVTQICV